MARSASWCELLRSSFYSTFSCHLSFLIPFFCLFGPAIFSDQSFVFRDAAHFYYPLLQQAQAEWSAWRIPLWNPWDNLGEPLLANATAAVFYPGKIIFAFPFEYATNYKLYIISHVLLAGLTAYGCARRFGRSQPAASLCAVSYAFSGSVLTQHCNVIYLIGAAWLPVALGATDAILRRRRTSAGFILLSASLAMVTLGGDPQTAYHAVLLAAIYALLIGIRQRRFRRGRSNFQSFDKELQEGSRIPQKSNPPIPSFRMGGKLIAVTVLGGCLAAVQIIPSVEWATYSDRASDPQPRSLWEAVRSGFRGLPRDELSHQTSTISRGLMAKLQPGTHQASTYEFSIAPWRLIELVCPNVSGRQFPVHHRWLNVVTDEGRLWTPTLYMGLLPLVLACHRWRLNRAPVRTRWLSWIALISVLGSFGWYGLGWLIYQLRFAASGHADADLLFGEPFGGVYWLMNVLLPGYAYFRYPAKLFVPASLAIGLLAAEGWDRGLARGKFIRQTLVVVATVSLTGLAVLAVLRARVAIWLTEYGPSADPLFGPLDTQGAVDDIFGALTHTAVVAGLLGWLWARWCATRHTPHTAAASSLASGDRNTIRLCGGHSAWLSSAVLLLTSVELVVAQRWLVPVAPLSLWRTPSAAARIIDSDRASRKSVEPFRIYRFLSNRSLPRRWSTTSSPDRQLEGLKWDRDTLFPKYHLNAGYSQLATASTMTAGDYRIFRRTARRPNSTSERSLPLPDAQVLDALGAQYLVLPAGMQMEGLERVARLGDRTDGIAVWHNSHFLPRVWVVPKENVHVLAELQTSNPAQVRERTSEILFPKGRTRDFRHSAVIEASTDNFVIDGATDRFKLADGAGATNENSCQIVRDDPQYVVIEVELKQPSLVVLADQFYPGWQLKVAIHQAPAAHRTRILRVNRIMRGAVLPAGRHRLEYRYRPTSFYVGAVISMVSWGLLAVGVFARWKR